MAAREVAAQVIEKLAHDFARFLVVEPYLWEYEPMLASGHFQDSLEPPSRFDAVVLILGHRLGTPLPPRTEVREYRGIDGRTPVTGTEWEFENALASARACGLPDLLVYRSNTKAQIDSWDASGRQAVLRQLEALDAFWSRYFRDGLSFIGGYGQFDSLEELAEKLEQDLRRCAERRIKSLSDTGGTERIWLTAPFRGLQSYEFEHAAILFGREEVIGAALLRLITNAQNGKPFLLLLGASGSGKSSLVKAGLVPRLLVPRRVSGVAFLRRVVFRPSDAPSGQDLFDALAAALVRSDGPDLGLPELSSPSMPVSDLARHLREASAHPGLPLAMVLDRIGEAACASGRMLRFERAVLVLVVDQLEEIFTGERVQSEERKRFTKLLAGFVASGRVWVIGTMRADFWHRVVDTPDLVQLADGFGRLDIMPPTPAEISQIIRRPAEAAAVAFELHATTGVPLNDLIATEAAQDAALPLLSYLLDQLYHIDIETSGGRNLTYNSYNKLGGLKGAIATRADTVIAQLPDQDRQALRQVLFLLVQMSVTDGQAERPVARRAPMEMFPPDTPKRRLVDALLGQNARLLVADAVDGAPASVRLAHEALISEWRTARDYLALYADALRIRRSVEERYARWRMLDKQRGDRPGLAAVPRVPRWLLHRARNNRASGFLVDIDLAEARRLVRDYRDELAPALVDFIEQSTLIDRRRRRRTLRVISSIAAAMTTLAIAAIYEAHVASGQRDAALQAQLRSLTQTAAARLNEHDYSAALNMILEVLPRGGVRRDYTPEALSVFQEARAGDVQLTALTGHSDRVATVAYSHDGHRLLTASYDKTARVWDTASGLTLVTLEGNTDRMSAAAFSPDDRRVATSSYDRTVRIWDALTGKLLTTLVGHQDYVTSVVFSPDGRRLASSSYDHTVRIWDAAASVELTSLRGHDDYVMSAAFSPDGRRIVTASADKTARIWDATAGTTLLKLEGHRDWLASAAFSPDGRRIVTSSYDHTARIWDSSDGRDLGVLRGHTAAVVCATFSPDGRRVVTGSNDGTMRIWDVDSGQALATLSGHRGRVVAARYSPDGAYIASGSTDGTARFWSASPRAQLLALVGHTDAITSGEFSRDGTQVITSSYDRTARIWDAHTGRERVVLRGHDGLVLVASFSPDGHRAVTGSYDRTVRIWDTETGAQLMLLEGHTEQIQDAEWSPDGRRIVTASADKTVRIWDAETGKQLRALVHPMEVHGAVFSPDGRLIASVCSDHLARLWIAETGQQLQVFRGHSGSVDSIEFSFDGRRILTASADRTARIWEVSTGKQLFLLPGHRGSISGSTFSPDAKRVATPSSDRTTRIWDASNANELLLLSGHQGAVGGAAFSPDGERILTVSEDATARIWTTWAPPLKAQIGWAEAAQFDVLSTDERFQLGLPPDRGVRTWQASSPCDRAAAAPYDPDRRSAGVIGSKIATDVAIEACKEEPSDSTSSARRLFQRGRALMAAGNYERARGDLEHALGIHYRAAYIDLAALAVMPEAGPVDRRRAIALYQHAWKEGVPVAAFELGRLYEQSAAAAAPQPSADDQQLAWEWYARGADAGEPNALARFGEQEMRAAFDKGTQATRDERLLRALEHYMGACERARLEDWPDESWQSWRYRRASLARLLALDRMEEKVALTLEAVHARYAHSAEY